MPIPSGTQAWLATGHADMRKHFDGLALLVQETLKRDPHGGHLFVFRGRFIWPQTVDGAVTITPAQLGYLREGIDWRHPQRTWRPEAVG
nr:MULTISPECIES: IS66 family insertion sequence element accessory protein TnpB [unclassified Bradyrhizobium]